MSADEAAKLEYKAKLVGLSQSSLIRSLIRNYAPREKPPPQFYADMRTLLGVANNINQIAKIANANKAVDVEQLKAESLKWGELHFLIKRRWTVPDKIGGSQ